MHIGRLVCPYSLDCDHWTEGFVLDGKRSVAGLIACEQRDGLLSQLKVAFEQWYEFKDIPGKECDAQRAERKVHHIQRALGDHYAKHGYNEDT
jgi:hypothetical protein